MSVVCPRFIDFFKAEFYENTYLPPQDLSEKALSKFFLPNNLTQSKAQYLFDQEAQATFSEPMTLNPNIIDQRRAVLQGKGFEFLSKKRFSVMEHPFLPGCVLKSAGGRKPKKELVICPSSAQGEFPEFSFQDSLLRLPMRERVANIANQIGVSILLPRKFVVPFLHQDKNDKDITKKYFVVAEKLDLMNQREVVEHIRGLSVSDQQALAKDLSKLIKTVGIVDTHFGNITFTKDKRLALIDTEPLGLMKKKEGLWQRLFSPSASSVEKCGRIGLSKLKAIAKKKGLEHFAEAIENPPKPKFSVKKIVFCAVPVVFVAKVVSALFFWLMTWREMVINFRLSNKRKEILLRVKQQCSERSIEEGFSSTVEEKILKGRVEQELSKQKDLKRRLEKIVQDLIRSNEKIFWMINGVPYNFQEQLNGG